jgi:hypothetical protein
VEPPLPLAAQNVAPGSAAVVFAPNIGNFDVTSVWLKDGQVS